MKISLHHKNLAWTRIRPAWLNIFVFAWAFLSVSALSADNNGPWTPEQSKTADHSPGTPSGSRGWYPPVDNTSGSTDVGNSSQPATSSTASTPSHYGSSDNNGPWTPEQSKTASHVPGTPKDPRGWYPPTTGSPNDKPTDLAEDLSNLGSKIATSNLANPLIQGGKAIGRTYEAADRGDMTSTAIEAADGIGRLSAIGLGATEGAALGSALGPIGTFIGGVVGGFIGNAGWSATGGAINESSRQMLEQQRAQMREQAGQIRQTMPTRPSSSGGSGGCSGPCGR